MSVDIEAEDLSFARGTVFEFCEAMNALMALQRPANLSACRGSILAQWEELDRVRVVVESDFVGDGRYAEAHLAKRGELSDAHADLAEKIINWFGPRGERTVERPYSGSFKHSARITFAPTESVSGHDRIEAAERLVASLAAAGLPADDIRSLVHA